MEPAAKLAGFGVTAMEVTVGAAADTVMAAVPLIPLSEAVTVVEPEATAVARPAALMVATLVFALTQVTLLVILAVVPLLYVPVAVYCCVAFAASVTAAGVTEMDDRPGGGVVVLTERVALPLTPVNVAVMVVEPAATPVARPAVLTVAMVALDDCQTTDEVTLPVVPLLKVAVAVNCSVAPRVVMVAVPGVTAMDLTVGDVPADEPHPEIPKTSGRRGHIHRIDGRRNQNLCAG